MKKKNILIVCGVILFTVLGCSLLEGAKYAFAPKEERYIDHIVNASADSSIGLTEIPEDRIVDASFTSHLPLIIIDTGGQEIVNYKIYNKDTDSFEVPKGIDPYCAITLSIIDNENHVNTLSDVRSVETSGKIKVRGNSSSVKSLPKYQYTVKLLDENGDNADVSLLDMGAENSWILTPTVKDLSYIRNYLAYNIAGQMEPYQPDVRYCEVLFKQGEQYEYMGLFMLCEPVEVSSNRINIEKDVSKYNLGRGYLLRKDRLEDSPMILYTWATNEGYYYEDKALRSGGSFFMVRYPSEEKVTSKDLERITNEISEIEQLLYRDELRDYSLIEQKLDIESFVDYMILNEFFGNYDSMLHSTYFYKSADGKMTLGPYWDFDNAMDNADSSMTNAHLMVMPLRAWFDCLVKMEKFTEKAIERYEELRENLLNEDYINTFIDDTLNYLGNAALRDRSAYSDYHYELKSVKEDVTGLNIDRNRYSVEEEALRIKDFLHEHGDYMDSHMDDLYSYVEDVGKTTEYNTLVGFAFIVLLMAVIVIAQRYQDMR